MNTLRLGSIGADVTAWQNILGIEASSVFDKQTEITTRAWQTSRHLGSDGVVGPMSWRAAGVEDAPAHLPVQGLDVSVIQGGSIPFDAEYTRGSRFLYTRCQVGNNAGKDTLFSVNTKRAMLAKLFCGAYFFPFPLPHLDIIKQVDLFLKALEVSTFHPDTSSGEMLHLLGAGKLELPPAVDLEWPPPEEWSKRGCTPDQIVDQAIAACEKIEKEMGVRPVLYSYPYFLACIAKAKNFAALTKYKLWIAGGNAYVNGDGHIPDLSREKPPAAIGWGDAWSFWQHDGNGGRRLTHGVDADFNVTKMTMEELEAFACGALPSGEEQAPDTLPDLVTMMQATSGFIVEDAIHAFRQERATAIVNTGV